MSMLTKKSAATRVRRRPAGKQLTLEQEILSLVGTRTPPPAKGTAADLLRAVESGEWGKGVDWARVELAYKSRSSSRLLRAS